ncbi:hypothetical protein KLP28_16180 [Nocardioidaceae bacterium]|nr:hypothetical protein KLP28_16180 [Nocardioidaceae bacterium]
MSAPAPLVEPAESDPFDLPEWLAQGAVVWAAEDSSRGVARAVGALRPLDLAEATRRTDPADTLLACDLLAVDVAHPRALVSERWRARAHADWARGEVLLLDGGAGDRERLVLACPAYAFDADLVLEALGRLARAVGVRQDTFRALLRP